MDILCTCQSKFRVKSSQAGQQVQCPACGAIYQIPAAKTSAATPPKITSPQSAASVEGKVPPYAPSSIKGIPQNIKGIPQYHAANHSPTKKSSGWQTALAVFLVVGVLLVVGVCVVIWAFRGWLNRNDPTYEYTQRGYRRVVNMMVNESGTINEDRVYTCNVASFSGDIDANLAVIGNSCDIDGFVNGDLDFIGNMLTIGPDAVIKGDLNVKLANFVNIHGRVEGDINGTVNFMNRGDEDQGVDREGIQDTRSTLDHVSQHVVAHAQSQNRLPNDDEGRGLLSSNRDAWGKEIRYEQNSKSEFVIRSAGPDGIWENADDVWQTERVRSFQNAGDRVAGAANNFNPFPSLDIKPRPGTTPPADSLPKSIGEAIRYLESPGEMRRVAAVEWLSSTTETPTDEQKARIVELTLPFLIKNEYTAKAKRIVRKWIVPDQLDQLVKVASFADDVGPAEALMTIFDAKSLGDGFAALLNHPSESVRKTALNKYRQFFASDSLMGLYSAKDLQNPNRIEYAIQRLNSLQRVDWLTEIQATGPLRTIVVDPDSVKAPAFDTSILNIFEITSRNTGQRWRNSSDLSEAAFELLAKWGWTYVDSPFLLQLSEEKNQPLSRRAIEELVRLRDIRVIPQLVESLGFMRHVDRTQEQIKKFGSIVEPYLLDRVTEKPLNSSEYLDLLASIGTPRSIPVLQRVIDDEQFRGSDYEFKKAIKRIRKSNRKSVGLEQNAFATYITRYSLDSSENNLLESKRVNGSLPELNLIGTDGWGSQIEYVRIDDDSFQLRSPGPDRISGNEDDIVETAPVVAPVDETQVASYLAGFDRSQQNAAMGWLSSVDSIGSEKRTPIIAGLIFLCNDIDRQAEAQQLLVKHLSIEDGSMLINAYKNQQKLPLRYDGFEYSLAKAVAEIDYQDGLVKFLNDEDQLVRNFVREELENRNIEQGLLVDACIADINEGVGFDVKLNAVDYLLEMSDIGQSKKAALFEACSKMLSAHHGAFEVMSRMGFTEDDGEMLAWTMNQNNQLDEEVGEFLPGLANDALIEKYAVQLQSRDNGERHHAVRVLKMCGSKAEDAVIEVLGHKSWVIFHDAARILEEIGTKKSIEPLTILKNAPRSGNFKERLEAIIANIKAREN